MNILNLEHISKNFGTKELLTDVSLGVNSGDKIGIIGVNGCGKSTLLKIAAGLTQPDDGQVVCGRSVRVRYLPQTPEFDGDESILTFVMRENPQAPEAEACKWLNQLGLTDPAVRVGTLSGGQKKRAALVQALMSPAEVLLLDEPTNHLDAEMIEWLQNQLTAFKGELLLVTHDRYFLDAVCSRIAEIDRGKLFTYEGNYARYLELKTARDEAEKSAEKKRQNFLRTELAWIRRGALARGTKQQARIDRFNQAKEESAQARRHMELESAPLVVDALSSRMGHKTVELRDVSKSMGGRLCVSQFTAIFQPNARIGIIGPNGCGKSTLLKLIAGELQPDEGIIETGGTIRVGYFCQENEPMDDSLTVLETVKKIGEYLPTRDGLMSASNMCDRFLFPPAMQFTKVGKLSGGEKRRLFLLQVLMGRPNVLLLDEPTNDLDIQTLEVLEDFLDRFDGIVITVSHDRYFLDRTVTRMYANEGDGKWTQYEGGYSDYYRKKKEREEAAAEEEKRRAQLLKGLTAGESDAAGPKEAATAAGRRHQRRLSYKEQREWDSIEDEISALEEKSASLEQEMAEAASDYDRLMSLTKEKEETDAKLEERMNRWEELSELVESLEKQ
ncbi:MAG: ABC-F family ATP-binding cassette domain-containing protein [Lachnospiraceae bacterium]|jgi:ATP-binding cassette subfamily F protein uup|nr:ABC-F family ATP-binding cassette domain-containing protein [Lachnospiraceae bacterium]MCH4031865.1 ABC-F family ATP-binding cassette domain-containing protein [Lachnospiraceae bacterium]MCH4070489.1 ABC-F family ATP-binding cassette domain-containing protein [Lachnospiraceae bacterium]MCH4109156.1 ABC-F family ATP-binding cassette domain-containing protein [Lachnospiraceae bacterium]MCI1302991.1 ABC-F family ATP-binding cassette domain-containing protein [Lachnospiraceae bacterium]